MGQETLDGADISALRRRYRRPVTEALSAAARKREGWPIREDHCFARVVLDALFGDE